MIRTLKDERGREKMEANKRTQRRAEVSQTPRPFTDHAAAQSTALTAAEQHRNRLLSYQATSAQRTRVIDETADFETPSSGQSIWASPQERALQLKRQQKVLREQEWNAKPAYEKRGTVLSIDLAGGKVMKKMGRIERPVSDEEDIAPLDYPTVENTQIGQGSFSRNPLLGTLIRPVYRPKEETARNEVPTQRQKTWRRVQDDNNDNEAVILDGGIYGQQTESSSAGPA